MSNLQLMCQKIFSNYIKKRIEKDKAAYTYNKLKLIKLIVDARTYGVYIDHAGLRDEGYN